ncbi:MAG TPA: peptidylprolyl isomerase [Gemmatimonadaceae bacterium]
MRRPLAAVTVALIVVGCHRAPASTGPLTNGASDRSALFNPDDDFWKQRAPDRFRVRVETTRGPFTLELIRELAPIGVDHFYNLVRAGYYDDSRFSRVVAGWIVQFGIAGDPRVTAIWSNRPILDDSVRAHNDRGTFTFAMRRPNDRTTQISISRRDNRVQDAQGFAPLGHVVQGMEIVDSLYSGYGETSGGGLRAGKQQAVMAGGNAYLDREFPRLDHLIRATIVPSPER